MCNLGVLICDAIRDVIFVVMLTLQQFRIRASLVYTSLYPVIIPCDNTILGYKSFAYYHIWYNRCTHPQGEIKAVSGTLSQTKEELTLSRDRVVVLEGEIKVNKSTIEELKESMGELQEERNR